MWNASGSAHFGEMLFGLMRRTVMPRISNPRTFLTEGHGPYRYPAALLVALCGRRHPSYQDARRVLSTQGGYFAEELDRICDELDSVAGDDPEFAAALATAAGVYKISNPDEAMDAVWQVTFPQGVGLDRDWAASVDGLRRRRTVEIGALNPDPITDPLREVLLTSNVLITPGDGAGDATYAYDHPIPLNADPATTELAHGLAMLDAAVEYELRRNPGWRGPVKVVLSVSVSHPGYEEEGLGFVRDVVGRTRGLSNLRVFALDETLSNRLWTELVAPAGATVDDGAPVFGVNGPYGRHYSFLKAIAALWAVCVDRDIRATFKFDLDQSFPQERLVAETGMSAFEHLTTTRWGSTGSCSGGQKLDFAMIAGGLVNETDVDQSVFTPDVRWDGLKSGEDVFFCSRLPQALSTEAEIVARYDSPVVDGVDTALERIHVTGGTTGITVAGLRRWRLFTPSAFGRAEDQAYALSADSSQGERPTHIHEPGLIMRHDKASLIPGIIDEGAAAKHIGDLVRIRLFSAYADDTDRIRLEPFTGCFVSRIPRTVSAMRFTTRALDMDAESVEGYLASGVRRLRAADAVASRLADLVGSERNEWNRFYDAIDRVEAGRDAGDRWAFETIIRIRDVVSEAEIAIG